MHPVDFLLHKWHVFKTDSAAGEGHAAPRRPNWKLHVGSSVLLGGAKPILQMAAKWSKMLQI